MNVKTWCVLVSSLVLVCGCDPEGNGGGGGEDCPAFTRITGGTFSRSADKLEWTLTVEELPAELPFNQTEVPENVLEYQWGVRIDPASDGAKEYLVAASSYASGEEVTGDIVSHTQHDLWEVDGPVGSIVGAVETSISGNTFTFVVALDEDPAMAGVTETSGHRFVTFHAMSGIDTCEDELVGLD